MSQHNTQGNRLLIALILAVLLLGGLIGGLLVQSKGNQQVVVVEVVQPLTGTDDIAEIDPTPSEIETVADYDSQSYEYYLDGDPLCDNCVYDFYTFEARTWRGDQSVLVLPGGNAIRINEIITDPYSSTYTFCGLNLTHAFRWRDISSMTMIKYFEAGAYAIFDY